MLNARNRSATAVRTSALLVVIALALVVVAAVWEAGGFGVLGLIVGSVGVVVGLVGGVGSWFQKG